MEQIAATHRTVACHRVHGQVFRTTIGYHQTLEDAENFFEALQAKYLVVELQRITDAGAYIRERLYDNSRDMGVREMVAVADKIRRETPALPPRWVADSSGLSARLFGRRSVRATFYMPKEINDPLLVRDPKKILANLRIGYACYIDEEYQTNTGSPSATLAHFLNEYRENHTVLVATNWVLQHHGLGPVTHSGV